MPTLASEVDVDTVAALLLARSPGIREGEQHRALYEATVEGVSTEVALVVGDEVPEGPTRATALWCIALGVASHLESAMFPERNVGEDSRADDLRGRYLGVLAQLRGLPSGAGSVERRASPVGSFPPPQPWPDPAFTDYPRTYL